MTRNEIASTAGVGVAILWILMVLPWAQLGGATLSLVHLGEPTPLLSEIWDSGVRQAAFMSALALVIPPILLQVDRRRLNLLAALVTLVAGACLFAWTAQVASLDGTVFWRGSTSTALVWGTRALLVIMVANAAYGALRRTSRG